MSSARSAPPLRFFATLGLGVRLDRGKPGGPREGAKPQSIVKRNWGTTVVPNSFSLCLCGSQ